VHFIQRSDLLARQVIAYDDDEIDVAVLVEVADGERALEIGADERVAERVLDAGGQVVQDGVEVGVRGWIVHRVGRLYGNCNCDYNDNSLNAEDAEGRRGLPLGRIPREPSGVSD
jgi:hypothetical protein